MSQDVDDIEAERIVAPLEHECSCCGIGPCDCAEVYDADDICFLCWQCQEAIGAGEA